MRVYAGVLWPYFVPEWPLSGDAFRRLGGDRAALQRSEMSV